jgi:UDP-N-acetylglucosamine:LPS N-acetylglucosamine transferase
VDRRRTRDTVCPGEIRDLKVMLVCSSGGHLSQLHKLEPWWRAHERIWLTFRKADSLSLLEGERVVWAYHPTTRNLGNLLRNLRLARRVLAEFRPNVVVSTGAGVAFPFFLLARVRGIRTVYVEVYDRIDSATLTGRLCYPLSDLFLLQWEEQRRWYPRGVVIGRVF